MSTKQALLKFRYSALDGSGKTVSGVEVASSSGAAHLALVQRGFQPLDVSAKKSIGSIEVTKKKVPRKEIMHFSRQMGVFMKAGIPIMEALEVIEIETTEKLMKKVINEMVDALRAGDTFAAAAASHPEAFPNFYVGILESAELTGNLDTVLDQLADYIERDVEARSTLTSALIYPAVVFCMSIGVVIVLATFVMPRFVVFFKSLHAKLPLPTRMLLSASSAFGQYWYAILLVVIAVTVGFVSMRRSDKGRALLDSFILKLPVLGLLVQAAVLERVCRVLSSMLKAGVDLPQAMAVTAEASNNAVYRNGLGHIREQMMEGQGLAGPLSETKIFPGAAKQMFRVGEETGTLDVQLETAAAYYHRELEVRVKHFTSLFEPAVIIFMGVVVGFVAVALISAMYGIYSQVKT
ncbi:MAG: type II secretion system F family protein [Acidimicrobiales bacterium]|jgi:type IV pilus assembly protein PilC